MLSLRVAWSGTIPTPSPSLGGTEQETPIRGLASQGSKQPWEAGPGPILQRRKLAQRGAGAGPRTHSTSGGGPLGPGPTSACASGGGRRTCLCLTSSHVAGPRGTDKSSLFSAQGVLDPPGEAPSTQEEQGWSEGMRCSLTGRAHAPVALGWHAAVSWCCAGGGKGFPGGAS